MEVQVVKKEDNEELLRIEGEDHTLANLLCAELYQDEAVRSASYTLDHPLTGAILLHLRTEGKSPEKVIVSITEHLIKKLQELKREAQASLKRV
jgi:DNA-directed RNA polymerase II subunit RPB11